MPMRGDIAVATVIAALAYAPVAFGAACEDAVQPGRFVVQGDEVQDTKTGLTWQRCSVGQKFAGDACSGAVQAMTWDQAKRAGRGGWRLPTLDEYNGLMMQPCGLSTEQKKVFGALDPLASSYWTGTATENNLAWTVGLNNGSTFNGYRTAPNAVRLVKGGK
ncbi:MAG: DUF1566 domain-containing protein [Rhodospirillaceae bacterium]|nr:DUF1566 domain-containing protein [Rhodospirillaceae bacterium]